jgi:hypothetical protein
MRSPSYPSLGSSVTSNRTIDQDRNAAAILLAVPGRPVNAHSALSCPGAAGCAVHDRVTRVPSTPEIAHSACGTTAGGHEWT